MTELEAVADKHRAENREKERRFELVREQEKVCCTQYQERISAIQKE